MLHLPNKKRPNKNAKIPYAYKAAEEDPLLLVADEEILPFLQEALVHLDNGHSFRKTAEWLTAKTGNIISHQGIANIWKRHRDPKKNERLKQLAKQNREKRPKTKEERLEKELKKTVSTSKARITKAKKRLNQLNPVDDSITNQLDFSSAEKEDKEIIFKPNLGPQTEFLASSEREVLYGGSAGSGKTYCLLADPMRYFGNPNFNGLILRRTNDELREIVWKSQELYPKAYVGAKWQEKKSQWVFPSGARLWMTYLERDEDVHRYQGQAFSYIAFDELTQYPTPFAWNYMRSRLRTTDPTLPVYQRATTNPGGPGHQWVKKMFIDPSPPNKSFEATDIETGERLAYPKNHEKAGKPLFYRRFIPAFLKDNPYLYNEGTYEANLLSLPETQRRQLLEGDWSVADGAAFNEFRTKDHVIEPFNIPPTWRRFRSCDYGYSSFSAVHWFAIDPAFETLYVYRELYLTKHTGKDLARAVLQAERGEPIAYGVLDSSCWHNRGQIGPSIAEEMIKEGCRWRPSDRSAGARVAGKNRLHELLKVDEETELPGIIFFNTCRQIIADLPIIPSDPKGGDDIDSKYPSDHSYDSVRYGVMSRPRSVSPFTVDTIQKDKWTPSDNIFGY
jgi:hypothetical protein